MDAAGQKAVFALDLGSAQTARAIALALLLAARLPCRAQLKAPHTSSGNFERLAAEADAARDADQLSRAADLYEKALEVRPGWAAGWWSLGTVEYDQNTYAGAARAFARVKALDAKSGTARVMLGHIPSTGQPSLSNVRTD